MHNIAVVVLHYETISDTIECINSLMNQTDRDFEIIIVDNGSVEGKIDFIKGRYIACDNVHFIISERNLGFAKGNNIGIKYAKKNLNADVIILANNDLIFEQKNFIKNLRKDLEVYHFDVAGPRIISLIDGFNQNPVRRLFSNEKDVVVKLLKLNILYLLNIFNLDLLLKNKIAKPIKEFQLRDGLDFQLHGACIILGNQYLQMYDGLYANTFMYGEEDILRFFVEKNNLKMVYLEDLEVKHKESSSTNNLFKKEKRKRNFYYKWSINSLIQLLKLYHG